MRIYLNPLSLNTDNEIIVNEGSLGINVNLNVNNDETLDNEKNLFISAYVALKSILHNTHHLVIYSNKKKNSESIIKYMKERIKNETI